MRQSAVLTDAAATATSTSPSPTAGRGTSDTVSTSAAPYRS